MATCVSGYGRGLQIFAGPLAPQLIDDVLEDQILFAEPALKRPFMHTELARDLAQAEMSGRQMAIDQRGGLFADVEWEALHHIVDVAFGLAAQFVVGLVDPCKSSNADGNIKASHGCSNKTVHPYALR